MIRKTVQAMERPRALRGIILALLMLQGISGCMAAKEEMPPPREMESSPAVEKDQAATSTAGKEDIQRKLIYNAEVEVLVPQYKKAEAAIKGTVERLGGYVQDTRTVSRGEGLSGTIILRVPAASFREILSFIEGLGEITSTREWTQDVTEEYRDVTKRISNLQVLENRLLSLLERQDAKLEDLAAVETKLAEVRTQIEQHQGRLLYLQNRISLSTITVTLYEPSSQLGAEESPLYPLRWAVDQIGYIFFGSVALLLVLLIATIPWSMLIYGLIRMVRALRARRRRQD